VDYRFSRRSLGGAAAARARHVASTAGSTPSSVSGLVP